MNKKYYDRWNAVPKMKNWYYTKFDSVSDFVEARHNYEPRKDNKSQCEGYIKEKPSKFRNKYDVKRVEAELNEPPSASAKVSEITNRIEESYEFEDLKRRMIHKQEQGDELNPEAWVQRKLDGWSDMHKEPFNKRVVRIAVNTSMIFHESPEMLWYRGAAAVALADALEAAGHSVEIVGFMCQRGAEYNKGNSINTIWEIGVKKPDQPVDVNTLALCLAEIGFFRTVGFVNMALCGQFNVCGSLGRPETLPKSYAKDFDIVMDTSIKNYDQALKKVVEYADKFSTKQGAGAS